jgi:DNA-directed RNA polymerase specialized sigma24 family protein
MDEAAELLDVSPRTAARDWVRARAFLKARLAT